MSEKVELPFDEVVDTVCDVIEIAQEVYEAGKDGFQATDAILLITLAPKIGELYDDRKVFFAQAADLKLDELAPALDSAAKRLKVTEGEVKAKFALGFATARRIKNLIDYNVTEGKAIFADVKLIFG